MNTETFLLIFMGVSIILGLYFALAVTAAQTYCVKVTGPSMEPLIKDGSFLKFQRTQDVNIGDIIEYRDSNRALNVVHQIISIENGLIHAKGTNWLTEDEPFERKMVYGKWTGEFLNACVTSD